jgi:hypothetical protein
MRGSRWIGGFVAIGTTAGAVVFAVTPTRYRASSTVRFTCEDCRLPENFGPTGLLRYSLGWPVNDVRSRFLKEVGPETAVTIGALEAETDTSAGLRISYDSADAVAAAREAARRARRIRDIVTGEWQPPPTPEPVDRALEQRLSELKSRLVAVEAALEKWKKRNAGASPSPEPTREHAKLQADYNDALRRVDESHVTVNDMGPRRDWMISILDGVPETTTVPRFAFF